VTEAADVMVVAAHPDDAEFGAGGVVAGWTKKGKQVVYVVCTNGDKGTSDRNVKPDELAKIRKREQMAAANVLGVREVKFLGYSDQSLEDTPQFRKDIVRLLRRYRPQIVVTSDPYRRYLWHRDHRIAGQVTLDAVFPYARDHLAYPDLLAEGLEPHKVREIWFWASEDINHRCDVTDTFDVKIAALDCHESQMREYGNARVKEWVRARCTEMAKGEDFELAEGFHRAEAAW
jgi:LmbE family N-acetylglucosaminyl deacetylase